MINKIKNFKTQRPFFFDLACGILTALLFSAFIYFEEYDVTLKIVNTVFGILALALLLHMPRRAILVAGFFIGLFWFYWIGYSFKYQGVGYMTPIITFAFAVIYMLFFGVLALTQKIYIRAFLLFGLSFFEPFDFNWMQIELIFVDSYLGVFKYQLALILLALSLPVYLKKPFKYAPLLLIIFAINFHTCCDAGVNTLGAPNQSESKLKIKLVATDIKQEKKWLRSSFNSTVLLAYKEIQKAINDGYDVIVLPESFFPVYMNKVPKLINELSSLSHKITIVTGALLLENTKHYNVTYVFEKGKYKIAKKMVLVPFGEYIPLPKFAQKFINDNFFSGASDFKTATEPTDFMIKGEKFRNAICYEATCQEIYEGDVKKVIAISNNAWFSPSIEPTLQKLLMKYYARKNGTVIYHSANWSGSGVIK